jgi:hypothetical protein
MFDKFLQENFCIQFFLQTLFQSAQHSYEKREVSGSGSESVHMRNESDEQKTYGSGSGTLLLRRYLNTETLDDFPKMQA